MEVYISATSAISPQDTFYDESYLEEIVAQEGEYLQAVEPDYKDYIDPRLSRRMARIIKMGVSSAIKSLRDAGIENPDAIILGTGLGCLKDTERFLTDIIENDEGVLSPTPFIQSTHNTIGGQIALMLGCNRYNYTYVHRGHSFESALLDAFFKLEEGVENVLVGGVDEATATTYKIMRKMRCISPNYDGYAVSPGKNDEPVLGEGAAFFVLSKNPIRESYAKISGIKTIYKPDNSDEVVEEIKNFLATAGVAAEQVSVLLSGMNGNKKDDVYYEQVHQKLFSGKPMVRFKNLSGEYQTASAFGMNLAAHMLKNQKKYPSTAVFGVAENAFEHILLYNHYKQKNHNLILLSRC